MKKRSLSKSLTEKQVTDLEVELQRISDNGIELVKFVFCCTLIASLSLLEQFILGDFSFK